MLRPFPPPPREKGKNYTATGRTTGAVKLALFFMALSNEITLKFDLVFEPQVGSDMNIYSLMRSYYDCFILQQNRQKNIFFNLLLVLIRVLIRSRLDID